MKVLRGVQTKVAAVSILALYWHRRQRVYCAGMGVLGEAVGDAEIESPLAYRPNHLGCVEHRASGYTCVGPYSTAIDRGSILSYSSIYYYILLFIIIMDHIAQRCTLAL